MHPCVHEITEEISVYVTWFHPGLEGGGGAETMCGIYGIDVVYSLEITKLIESFLFLVLWVASIR